MPWLTISLLLSLSSCVLMIKKPEVYQHSQTRNTESQSTVLTLDDFNNLTNEIICPEACHCRLTTKSGVLVDCSNRKLEQIPEVIPRETTILDLSNNRISNISNNSFQELGNLQQINLSNNVIERLESNSFFGLSRLLFLSLAFNRLKYADALPDGVFVPLNRLTELQIHGNCDASRTSHCAYYDTAISKLSLLQSLSLDGLSNANLGPGFLHLHNLRELTFGSGYCWMSTIAFETFRHFVNSTLQRIELRNCHIIYTEANLFSRFRFLKSLDITDNGELCENGLRNVTNGLESTHIEYLGLRHNCDSSIMRFENEIYFNLSHTKLKYLDLGQCSIEFISIFVIVNLPISLEYLILKDNKIRKPVFLLAIPYLSNLKYLDGSIQSSFHENNRNEEETPLTHVASMVNYTKSSSLLTVPEQFWNRSRIHLKITSHEVKHIPFPNPVQLPPKLELLNASYLKIPEYSLVGINFTMKNVLKIIDSSNNMMNSSTGMIRGLHHLRFLNLSSNRLGFVHPDTFADMRGLEWLNLQHNEIGRYGLAPRVFSNLSNLAYLDLSVNVIKSLPCHIFTSLRNLTHLLLNNNYLVQVQFSLHNLLRLKVLDMSNNQLSELTESMRTALDTIAAHHQVTVFLQGNKLWCKCNTQAFMKWLMQTDVQVQNSSSLFCELSNNSVISLSRLTDINEYLENNCMSWSVLIACITVFVCLLLVLTFIVVIHEHRWKFRYLNLIGRRNINPYHPIEDSNIQLDNDIYFSFNDENDAFYTFVTKDVYTALKRRGYSVKIRSELKCGERMYDVIASAIRHSRKVAVFLTVGYSEDFWNMFEFNMAACEGIYTKRSVIIPVSMGDFHLNDFPSEIKAYLKGETILEYKPTTKFSDFLDAVERKML